MLQEFNFPFFNRLFVCIYFQLIKNCSNFFYNLPVRDFDARNLPTTELLAKQKVHSFKPVQLFWFNALCKGFITSEYDSSSGVECGQWPKTMRLDKLYESYKCTKDGRADQKQLTTFWEDLSAYLPDSVAVGKAFVLTAIPAPPVKSVAPPVVQQPSYVPRGRPAVQAKKKKEEPKYWIEIVMPDLNECKQVFAKKVPGIEYFWSSSNQKIDPELAALSKKPSLNRVEGVSSIDMARFAWAPRNFFGSYHLRYAYARSVLLITSSEHS